MNLNALIVSDMNAALRYDSPTYAAEGRMHYQDGFRYGAHVFEGYGFGDTIHLQNAASGRWNEPRTGVVHGAGTRVEPLAMGGVKGRGFWLHSDSAIEYTIPAQTLNPASDSWFVGILVDGRFANDGNERRLLTFPDGSYLAVRGRERLIMQSSVGNRYGAILPGHVAGGAWRHLGLRFFNNGARVEFYLNGFLFREWTSSTDRLFRIRDGRFTVGQPRGTSIASFRGWVDELRVISGVADYESICNYARGTMLTLTDNYTGELKAWADRYPAYAHQRVRNAANASGTPVCWTNYEHLRGINSRHPPSGAKSLKQSLQIMQEVVHNEARPDFSSNAFCTSCHSSTSPGALNIRALEPLPRRADRDRRRNPMAPLRLLPGTLPEDLFGTRTNPPLEADAGPHLIDSWMFPE